MLNASRDQCSKHLGLVVFAIGIAIAAQGCFLYSRSNFTEMNDLLFFLHRIVFPGLLACSLIFHHILVVKKYKFAPFFIILTMLIGLLMLAFDYRLTYPLKNLGHSAGTLYFAYFLVVLFLCIAQLTSIYKK